jgi:uncharacterized membrane protein
MSHVADTIMAIVLLLAVVVSSWIWILGFWMNILYWKYRKTKQLYYSQVLVAYGYGFLGSVILYVIYSIYKYTLEGF